MAGAHDDGPSTIRLFVEASLEAGTAVALASGQAHYLRNVMRRKPGDRIRLFNGRDGEWEGAVETLAPGRAGIRLGMRLAAQPPAPDLRLLFAPLKAERTRFTVEKATELGVGAIHPVLTRYGQTKRVNVERLRAHAIEAAEQCGRLEVPSIAPPCPLPDALGDWPPERRLLVCDPEARSTMAEAVEGDSGASWAILI
ncbi:MAG: RsmE family RNA methyltransferase, partial [Rhodospirillales bacterium]|nr:RsmE family RNA methyltransferase [Rhodospirillales bacterium]